MFKQYERRPPRCAGRGGGDFSEQRRQLGGERERILRRRGSPRRAGQDGEAGEWDSGRSFAQQAGKQARQIDERRKTGKRGVERAQLSMESLKQRCCLGAVQIAVWTASRRLSGHLRNSYLESSQTAVWKAPGQLSRHLSDSYLDSSQAVIRTAICTAPRQLLSR